MSTWDILTEPAHAIACADLALYEAKRTGRDRVLSQVGIAFDKTRPPAMPAFGIVLQPIIDIVTGKVAGHEALTRFDGTGNDPRGVFRLAHIDGYGDLLEAATITAALAVPDRPVGQALYVNASARALSSSRFWALMPTRLDTVVVEAHPRTSSTWMARFSRTPWHGSARGVRPSRWTISAPEWASSIGWPRCALTSSRRTARWSRAVLLMLARAPYCKGW